MSFKKYSPYEEEIHLLMKNILWDQSSSMLLYIPSCIPVINGWFSYSLPVILKGHFGP